MKTKLTLLKNALFVAFGLFALSSCSKDPNAMSYKFEDLPGNFIKGTANYRPAGTASAPYGGVMVTYTNVDFTITAEQSAGGQALRFTAENGSNYSIDVVGVYTEKRDQMVFKAEGVTYTYKGATIKGDLYAKCKPNGFTIEIGNYTAGDPQQGALFRYDTHYRDNSAKE